MVKFNFSNFYILFFKLMCFNHQMLMFLLPSLCFAPSFEHLIWLNHLVWMLFDVMETSVPDGSAFLRLLNMKSLRWNCLLWCHLPIMHQHCTMCNNLCTKQAVKWNPRVGLKMPVCGEGHFKRDQQICWKMENWMFKFMKMFLQWQWKDSHDPRA